MCSENGCSIYIRWYYIPLICFLCNQCHFGKSMSFGESLHRTSIISHGQHLIISINSRNHVTSAECRKNHGYLLIHNKGPRGCCKNWPPPARTPVPNQLKQSKQHCRSVFITQKGITKMWSYAFDLSVIRSKICFALPAQNESKQC